MNSTPVQQQNQNATEGRVTVALLQHWALMVNEQREQLATAEQQIRRLDDRASRLYRESITLHGLFNESEAELHYFQQTNQRLSLLISRILSENPGLSPNYTHLYQALIEGTEENPIDLTTDEEIDEEL